MYNIRKIRIKDKIYTLIVNIQYDQTIVDMLKSGPLNDLIKEGEIEQLENVLWHHYDTFMVEEKKEDIIEIEPIN